MLSCYRRLKVTNFFLSDDAILQLTEYFPANVAFKTFVLNNSHSRRENLRWITFSQMCNRNISNFLLFSEQGQGFH